MDTQISKRRLLMLLKLLRQPTDEEHTLSTVARDGGKNACACDLLPVSIRRSCAGEVHRDRKARLMELQCL